MAFKQVLWPNLDNDPAHPLYIRIGGQILTDWLGWCLAVVAGSFGARGSSYSAKTAWQSCPTKHYDRNIPERIWTPLWYEGGDYGHVVTGWREGNTLTVYSSPWTHKATFDVFKGDFNYILDYIGRVYGVGSFTGWSETVLDSRVMEWYDETPRKSNEEICREIWNGEWGVGQDRRNRLTEAGYDYDTIQRMIDAGVGKPEPVVEEPKPEPTPEPEPVDDNNNTEPSDDSKGEEQMTQPTQPEEPAQNGSQEPTNDNDSSAPAVLTPDDNSGTSQPDSKNKNNDETTGAADEFVPATAQDAQLVRSIIEEAGDGFDFSKKVKFIAYLVGDALLVASLLIPDVINTIQAPTAQIWAEYLSKVLLEGGIAVLTVFKLFKRKSK